MDRRKYHRAHLRLPVRLRWNTPFGQQTELTNTLDVSRGGLCVTCENAHASGANIWVTFPYDAALGDGQPEVLARVIRSAASSNTNGNAQGRDKDGSAAHMGSNVIGLRLSAKPASRSNGNHIGPEVERRANPRRSAALQVRVRPEGVPWFEETMTADFSESGVRFLSNREYQVGDNLMLSFDSPVLPDWPSEAEIRVRVVRLEAIPQSAMLSVATSRMNAAMAEASLRRHLHL